MFTLLQPFPIEQNLTKKAFQGTQITCRGPGQKGCEVTAQISFDQPTAVQRIQMEPDLIAQNNKFDFMNQQQKDVFICPSILSADFGQLAKDCQEVINLGANSLHIDVMDGHFVPNLTIGPPVVKSMRKHLPNVHFDCHMNVTNPRAYIEQMGKIGVDCFTFHYEADHGDLKEMCDLIRKNNMGVGMALSPKTPVDETIEELIAEGRIDKLLVMTVEPGFGGQKFMPNMMEKVEHLSQKFPNLKIQVDGGIGPDNSKLVAKHGASWLVAGSAIFCAKDRKKAIEDMKSGAIQGLKEHAAE